MADLNLFIDRDGIEPLKKEEVVQEEKGTPSKYDLFLDEFAEEKPTLVLIHGFGAGGAMFFPSLKPLLDQFRIVLVDLLGFGGSTRVQLSEATTSD